jgi:acetyl esterase
MDVMAGSHTENDPPLRAILKNMFPRGETMSDEAHTQGLHPVVAALIERSRAAGMPAISAGTVAHGRALFAATSAAIGAGPDVAEWRGVEIPARGGMVSAMLCVPQGELAGLCVYLHGGGWVVGTASGHEALARTLAARSLCAVLVPDYRLAPEHPFPAGLEDCEDVLLWAAATLASELGPALPLVVAGDSAGGNLATVAARRLAGRVKLAGQALIYPVTDADFDTESYLAYGTGLPLTRADMPWFFSHYAPKDYWTDPAISPLRAPSLAGCPPAVIALAEYDVLRDDGLAYARRLEAEGLLAGLRRYPDLTHGSLRLHNLVDSADRMVGDLAADIRRFCIEAVSGAR